MNMITSETLVRDYNFPGSMVAPKQGTIVLFCDDPGTIASLDPVCEFLDLHLEVVSAGTDFTSVLRSERPLAVISDMDGEDHDGFHTMRLVARFDPDLPVLMLTNGDPAMMGAADAVQEMCGLTSVTRTSGFPLAGQLMAFLFTAGRKAGAMRLVPI